MWAFTRAAWSPDLYHICRYGALWSGLQAFWVLWNTTELEYGYLCEPVYLWLYLWQPYPSAMQRTKQFPGEKKWTKQLWPVQWAHPGNVWSAEFTAVTDFYSNNLQGCLCHFPDCECMEIFLGISSLELRLRKTHLLASDQRQWSGDDSWRNKIKLTVMLSHQNK